MFYFENWASIEFRCPQEALTGSDNVFGTHGAPILIKKSLESLEIRPLCLTGPDLDMRTKGIFEGLLPGVYGGLVVFG
uniref:Uncharacterized protein n=1 Tax=Lepeophtheirus salmonis TaxID=72036 RepID=A0A0K2T514_LEPSM